MVMVSLFSPLLIANSGAYAQLLPFTEKDLKSVDKSEEYYDNEDITNLCTTSSDVGASSVFMIGDSVLKSSEDDIKIALSKAGFLSSSIKGVDNLRLTEGDSSLDGISVIGKSESTIISSDIVVVALGPGSGINADNVTSMIDAIKLIKKDPNIYWVNIGVDNSLRDTEVDVESLNSIIDANKDLGYEVVDWASVVSDNTEIIRDDGTGINPTSPKGTELFANTITQAISTGISSGDPSCGTYAKGDNNEEIVWNYMLDKGLLPHQIAGFMGNIKAESHFEPRLVEYGLQNSRGEISVAGQPSSLDENIPPNQFPNGRPGYGLVQWTSPGRKTGLQALSDQSGKPVSDITLQLDFIWVEITARIITVASSIEKYGTVSTLDALKATPNVDEATELITRNYEIPSNIDSAVTVRIGFANELLVKYGSAQ